MDADKTTAAGLITSSKWSVAGFPPPSPAKPLGVIVDEIRSNRKKLLDQRMVLVCQFDGTADPLKIHAQIPAVAFGGYVSSVRRTGIDPEMEVKLKTEFERCFGRPRSRTPEALNPPVDRSARRFEASPVTS